MSLADDLAGIRTTINGFLPEPCTITRTGVSTICKVGQPKVRERLEGAPSILRIWGWPLELPDGIDVRAGDQVVVTGMGTYQTILVTNPQSYSLSTDIIAAQVRTAGGSPIVPFITNASVTFKNPMAAPANATVTASAYIYPAAADIQKYPDASGYEWAVIFDGTLTYPDGAQIIQGHQIAWSGLGDVAASQRIVISKPRRYLSPIPYSIAYFLKP